MTCDEGLSYKEIRKRRLSGGVFGDGEPYEYLSKPGYSSESQSCAVVRMGRSQPVLQPWVFNGRFDLPPEYSELKGEVGHTFHWQKNKIKKKKGMRCAIRSSPEDISGTSELKLQLHLPTLQSRHRNVLSFAANKKMHLLKTEKHGVEC